MKHLFAVAACALGLTAGAQEAGVRFTEYVNPFIGTTNLGTLRPLLPDGIPGNDDAGTMSAWAIFSMMGFYPDIPGIPTYTLTTPTFDKVTIHLDKDYYPQSELVIEVENPQSPSPYIEEITDGQRRLPYRISHNQLLKGLKFKKK